MHNPCSMIKGTAWHTPKGHCMAQCLMACTQEACSVQLPQCTYSRDTVCPHSTTIKYSDHALLLRLECLSPEFNWQLYQVNWLNPHTRSHYQSRKVTCSSTHNLKLCVTPQHSPSLMRHTCTLSTRHAHDWVVHDHRFTLRR